MLRLIKKIDNDDELFSDWICKKPLVNDDYFIKNQQRLSRFLKNIFNQEPSEALRKPYNEFSTQWYKNKLIKCDSLYNAGIRKTLKHLAKIVITKTKKSEDFC